MTGRLTDLKSAGFTPSQRATYDDIVSRRGGVRGPFLAWMRNPELAERAQKLGAYCRYDSHLPHVLSELAILVVARHWRAQAEWAIHAPIAQKAGVGERDIATILAGKDPKFTQAEFQLVYDYVKELLETTRANKDLHDKVTTALGEEGIVDLVGLIGYYGLVALTLNAFEIPVPDGKEKPFADSD